MTPLQELKDKFMEAGVLSDWMDDLFDEMIAKEKTKELKNKAMKNPKIKTRVVHSQTKSGWNVVGESLGGKYKIARVPYLVMDNQELSERQRTEAFEHAAFISYCFNKSDEIIGQ